MPSSNNQRHQRHRLIILSVIGVIVLLLGAVLSYRRYSGTKDRTQVVRLAGVPAAFYLPLMVAQDQAMFQDYGLKSELILFNNNNDMMNALLHGDATLAGSAQAAHSRLRHSLLAACGSSTVRITRATP